jgi:hypothetical protein
VKSVKSKVVDLGIAAIQAIYISTMCAGSITLIYSYSQLCSKYCAENLSHLGQEYQEVFQTHKRKMGM